ncbi:uncharacterized protein LOC143448694 [Clavelina lepadiformis]|uniref:uncharacterized protein LOC143448694 n=1 Tax=Clavelina lepadiformis TaxID=159417 RepID=UPI0040433B88
MLQNRVVLCLVSILIYKAAPINGNVCSTFYTATSAVDTFPLTDPCTEVTKFSSEPAVVLVQGGEIPDGEDYESCVQDFPPTEPPPPPPSLELECGEDGEVKIRLSADTLDDLQVEENDTIAISSLPVHDLNSIDLGCVANSTHPEFNLGINNCSSVESTGDLLQATFTVRRHIYFNQSQPIQRYNDSCVNLTCEWNLTVVVNSSAIFPEIKKLELDAVEEKGEFDVGISFTNDSTYSTELPENSQVKVSDYVHVKVDLTGVDLDSSLHLQLTECWARPKEIATGSPMYSIINDSCPADNSFDPDDAIMIDRNYDIKYSIFKFRSFVWTLNQEQAIYVYCDVTICHNDVGFGCDSQPACPGDKRRKRDLESSQSQHRVVASGPIFIAQNKKKYCEQVRFYWSYISRCCEVS